MGFKSAAGILLLSMASPLLGDVKLPAIFGDHMVLQRNMKVPIWGWADPGEAVTITVGNARADAKAGEDGRWKTSLEGLSASDKPIELTVSGKNTIRLHDVLVGDVWVCSGQSNMAFPVRDASNSIDAIKNSDHPTLRLFLVNKKMAFDPQTDCVGKWVISSPQTVAGFSAAGYFFALDIMMDQHMPMGMIGAYWESTPAQAWTSLDALEAEPQLAMYPKLLANLKSNLPQRKETYQMQLLPNWKAADEAWLKQYGPANAAKQPAPPEPEPPEPVKPVSPDEDNTMAGVLSNGMIAPIIPYGIKGVIWYQGEANEGSSMLYRTLFPTLITDWRTRWGEGDFPFIWVQLANFRARLTEPTQTSDFWPGIREAQSMTLKLPNTGQAVTIDLGQADNLHPKDKLDVGHRLALAARHVAYGEDIVFSGPTFDSMKIDGDKATIKFRNIGSGLMIEGVPSTQPYASELGGFSIAGTNRKFFWANAIIAGDTVTVSNTEVHDPKSVRYAWANNPQANLYNKEGLPASPFRTDDWEASKFRWRYIAAAALLMMLLVAAVISIAAARRRRTVKMSALPTAGV